MILMMIVGLFKIVLGDEIPRLSGKPSDILIIGGFCGDNYNSKRDGAMFFKYGATDNLKLLSKVALNERYPFSLGWDIYFGSYGFLNYYLSQEIYFDKYHKAIYSTKLGYEIHPKTKRGINQVGSVPISIYLELGAIINPIRPKIQIGVGVYLPKQYKQGG